MERIKRKYQAGGEAEKRVWWKSGWIQNRESWGSTARKLHLKFGHVSKEKLKRLVKEAYGKKLVKEAYGRKESREYVKECQKEIGNVCAKYETSDGTMITHYCQGSWIRNKTPREVIKTFTESWIGVFEEHKMIFNDNGLEFQNHEMRRITERV